MYSCRWRLPHSLPTWLWAKVDPLNSQRRTLSKPIAYIPKITQVNSMKLRLYYDEIPFYQDHPI